MLLGLLTVLVFGVLIVRNAWVGDDAFITLRTVFHALEGHGLRFNIAERVQAYTHPLWMLVLLVAHGLTGEPYYGTLVVSGLFALLALVGLVGHARSERGLLLALVWLASSKAFVDYCTSGLENPLSYALLVGLFLSVGRGSERPADLLRSTLLLTAALLNRMDTVLLMGPLWLLHVGPHLRRRATFGVLALGVAPFVAWELFSLVYYGALVPNTAFAKLGAGVPRTERLTQGLRYLVQPATVDPATFLAVIGLPLGLFGNARLRALSAGAVLYAVYVVWIGGDFMAGRYWSTLVLAMALMVADLERPGLGVLAVFGAFVGMFVPHAPVWSGPAYEAYAPWKGIVDERGFYHQGGGLLAPNPGQHRFGEAGRRARDAGKVSVTRATIGYFGYFAGPSVHVVDPLGLSEPLLARLPARYDPDWRVGHYRRAPVPGYSPANQAPPDSPDLAVLYEEVQHLTRGPLFAPSRWWTGLRLQFAGPAFDPVPFRFAGARAVDVPFRGRVPEAGLELLGDPGQVVVDADRPFRVVLVGPGGQEAFHVEQTGPHVEYGQRVFVYPYSRRAAVVVRELSIGPASRPSSE